MENKQELLLPSEYAKLKNISKAAVSKQMAANKLVLVIKDGRRMIKVWFYFFKKLTNLLKWER